MKPLYWLLCGLLAPVGLAAQTDDLLKALDEGQAAPITYTAATFKGSRLISGHSVETVKARHLDFLISHRFGRLNSGVNNFWGLDESRIRLGLEYGLTNRLTVGIGRSSEQKTIDVFGKYRLLWQQPEAMPVSVTAFVSDALVTEPSTDNPTATRYTRNSQRHNFTGQLLIVRKFSEALSVQLMPSLLKLGRVESGASDVVTALGAGVRMKITKRVSVNAEYYHRFATALNAYTAPGGGRAYDALAIGFDIETGGHVFQLHFTNARGMIEKQFLAQTTGQWGNGDIHYGFNISRVFSFDKKARKAVLY